MSLTTAAELSFGVQSCAERECPSQDYYAESFRRGAHIELQELLCRAFETLVNALSRLNPHSTLPQAPKIGRDSLDGLRLLPRLLCTLLHFSQLDLLTYTPQY